MEARVCDLRRLTLADIFLAKLTFLEQEHHNCYTICSNEVFTSIRLSSTIVSGPNTKSDVFFDWSRKFAQPLVILETNKS